MAVKLSVTSKLDGIKSWSLQAVDTCPGAKDSTGELVAACKGCYATAGNYRYPNVKKPREFNRTDWKRDDWADEMVAALQDSRFFRWFDSGDLYAVALAEKILEVITRTPWVQHWLPTRSHKFAKFRAVLDKINALDNAVVRFSSDSITGEIVENAKFSSTILPDQTTETTATICRAYDHGGKCNNCRACWSREIPVIAYIAHGRSMTAQYKKLTVANI
jgi:hypothetical protein